MERKPKTIQIYLPHGEPRGIRLAEITSRTIRAIQIPRNRLEKASELEGLREVGVYFLLGESDSSAKPEVYIGEAENTFERLQEHNREKGFWNSAIAIVSRTDRFTKAQARYLDWLCWRDVLDVHRYEVKNTNTVSEPYISGPIKAELRDHYETVRTLLSTLGFPFLEDSREWTVEEVLTGGRKTLKGKDSTGLTGS